MLSSSQVIDFSCLPYSVVPVVTMCKQVNSRCMTEYGPVHEILIQAAKAQMNLYIHVVSPEPSLLAYTKYGHR